MQHEEKIEFTFDEVWLMREKCPDCHARAWFGWKVTKNLTTGVWTKRRAARCQQCLKIWTAESAPNNFLTPDRKRWLILIDLSK